MLSFFINYLCPINDLVYDHELNRCYLKILRNGSTFLRTLAEQDPNRFFCFTGGNSIDFLKLHRISTITVFLRDPIERFLSGLWSQKKLYGLNIDSTINYWEENGSISIFDMHTLPQFSYLLRASKHDSIQFDLVPLDTLNEFYPMYGKINALGHHLSLDRFSKKLQDKIDHFFTEDIVLYNQFLHKIVTLESVIEQIRKENTFCREYQSYYKSLTYL